MALVVALVEASVVVGGDGDLTDTLGSSLVLHKPEGLHYRIWKRRICKMAWVNLSPRLGQNYTA